MSHKSPAVVLNNRSLGKDFPTLIPILKEGIRVLDVGCGTGAITKGIAEKVGMTGHVLGIDRNSELIAEGNSFFDFPDNLELITTELFDYEPREKFDLIVSARALQWLPNPEEALQKIRTWLKPGGQISILDYNHETLSWTPPAPKSMQDFYQAFLDWRSGMGCNNSIADDLARYFDNAGFEKVEVIESNEVYRRGEDNFLDKTGIWLEVAKSAGLKMVNEGFASEELRQEAMKEYRHWMETEAEQMVMTLNDVRGTVP